MRSGWRVAGIMLGAMLLAGCGSSRDAAVPGGLVWPAPPDEPRIRYLQTYRGEDDFQTAIGGVLSSLGGEEKGVGLVRPFDVTTDGAGRIYVSDVASGVIMFDTVARDVRRLGSSSPVPIRSPRGLDYAAGKLFVGLQDMGQVMVLSADGEYERLIGAPGQFPSPVDVVCDRRRGLLYVVDNKLHTVQVFTLAGDSVRTVGARGEGPGEFNFPQSAVLDRDGNLYVVDAFNYRVEVFDTAGVFVRQFGSQGNIWGAFSRPKGIALDSFGNVYVLDADHDNFQVFNQEGQLLLFVGKFSHENDGFENPVSIHIDAANRIYVTDPLNKRLQVFALLRGD